MIEQIYIISLAVVSLVLIVMGFFTDEPYGIIYSALGLILGALIQILIGLPR